jgi:hypothetical protein
MARIRQPLDRTQGNFWEATAPLTLMVLVNLFLLWLETAKTEPLTPHETFVAVARGSVCTLSAVLLIVLRLGYGWCRSAQEVANSAPSQSRVPPPHRPGEPVLPR